MTKPSFIAFVLVLTLGGAIGLFGQDKKAPEKLTFAAKNGDVTFDHSAHVKRAKGECKTCHPALFKEDAKAPLEFKAGMHKPAETAKTSCGGCHTAGGAAFETKGNCSKCHVKA